jgi:hypothetical protein
MVPVKYEVDEGGCLIVFHCGVVDCKSASKNACCLLTEKFCNGLLGGQNLQFDKLDNLFLCCMLEE